MKRGQFYTKKSGGSHGTRWVSGNMARGHHRKSASKRSHALVVGKVYRGPMIEGKPIKLIEITSGEVEDRKPHFV